MEKNFGLGGGPITTNMQSSNDIKEITTPSIVNDIKYGREDILGYFKISNVLDKPGDAIYSFFDIDILLTAHPDWTDDIKKKAVEELGKLSKISDPNGFDTVDGDPT